MKTLTLVLRSLLWTILLPGVVAGYVPWRYLGVSQVRLDPSNPLHLLGLLLITIGAALLGACIWEFARRGRGTLSPVDPPKELVVHGLYRYVRNPMYVSVSTIVFGEALLGGARLRYSCTGRSFLRRQICSCCSTRSQRCGGNSGNRMSDTPNKSAAGSRVPNRGDSDHEW